jgi:hypothetical protein
LSTNTPTKVGERASEYQSQTTSPDKAAVMDAIDRLFAEFELVFHNQYNKAFPTPEKLMYAKKLWFDYLRQYQPEVLLAAAKRAVQESEFLPSIATLLKHCGGALGLQGLPDAYSAYREACNATTPKAEYQWSHPAVYHAGKASDWYFLATQMERKALPVFSRNYQSFCERVAKGETLTVPSPKKLKPPPPKFLDKASNHQRMQQLRSETDV